MDKNEQQTIEFDALKDELGLKGNQVTAAIKKYNASTFDECMQALRNYHQFKYPHLYETCSHCHGDGVLDEESGDIMPEVEGDGCEVCQPEGTRYIGNHPVTGKAVYK